VTCTHSKQGRAHGQRARAANKGKGVAHRGKALLIDWWRTLGWQKSSTPTLCSLVWSSSSGLALMCMTQPKHTQAKVGCAGLLHAAVCSSAPQCLEPFPPAPIVELHPRTIVYIYSQRLSVVRTKARVGPGTVCLPALCSGEPLRRAGNSSFQPWPSEKCDSHQWWGNGPNKCTVASCETCFDEATRA